MDATQSQHLSRVRHLRESFAEANERLVTRLRRVTDAAAQQAGEGGGWSAAQIGWHVAAVTTQFAGVMSGDLKGAQPLPPDFQEREWASIAAQVPQKLTARGPVLPPAIVGRNEAIAALETAGTRMARALDTLTPARGARTGITHQIVGTISLYQLGEWATAHVIRHNRQAKRVLGEG
jgi:DinB family protein